MAECGDNNGRPGHDVPRHVQLQPRHVVPADGQEREAGDNEDDRGLPDHGPGDGHDAQPVRGPGLGHSEVTRSLLIEI